MLIDEIRSVDVNSAKTFSLFCTQNFGTPYATIGDLKMLGKQTKDLFGNHPNTDWQTMVQVAFWCHRKKRRMARVGQYVNQFRWAYADGAINLEGNVNDALLDERIGKALFMEKNDSWRSRLMRADGAAAKTEVLNEWEMMRKCSEAS